MGAVEWHVGMLATREGVGGGAGGGGGGKGGAEGAAVAGVLERHEHALSALEALAQDLSAQIEHARLPEPAAAKVPAAEPPEDERQSEPPAGGAGGGAATVAESGGVDSATTTQLKADVAKAFRRASQAETAVDSLQEHLGTMGARLEAVEGHITETQVRHACTLPS